MADHLTQLFERRAACFLAEDFVQLVRYFRYPCAAYFDDALVVVKTPAQMAAILARYRRNCEKLNVTAVKPRVVALTMRRNRKQSVWVHWQHLDSEGHVVSENQCRYMLNQRSTDPYPVVELMDYAEISVEAEMFGAQYRKIA